MKKAYERKESLFIKNDKSNFFYNKKSIVLFFFNLNDLFLNLTINIVIYIIYYIYSNIYI